MGIPTPDGGSLVVVLDAAVVGDDVVEDDAAGVDVVGGNVVEVAVVGDDAVGGREVDADMAEGNVVEDDVVEDGWTIVVAILDAVTFVSHSTSTRG